MDAFAAIADAIERIGGEGTISLGGAPVGEDKVAALRRTSVKVEPYVNQWACLQASDLFVTHHGRGSTHEGVACGTPMLSYPFFWDQPGLALRAEEFGVAKPVLSGANGQDGKLTASDVVAAIEGTIANHDRINEALERAQQWERRAIEERPAVIEAILSQAG
jgi:UDP:flavonoid glycosyltransferase YjiC (YdhE family)